MRNFGNPGSSQANTLRPTGGFSNDRPSYSDERELGAWCLAAAVIIAGPLIVLLGVIAYLHFAA